MSEYDDFEDQEFEGGNEDSKLLKDLRKQLKTLQKERDEWKSKYEEEARAASEFRLRDVLAESGIDSSRVNRIAKYMRYDGVDVNNREAVDAWLAENGADFGITPAEKADPERESLARDREQITNAVERGETSNRLETVMEQLKQAQTEDEVTAILLQNKDIKLKL